MTPDLTGRMAKCAYSHDNPTPAQVHNRMYGLVPSDPSLAFFEFLGEGSREATEGCKHCIYWKIVHDDAYHAIRDNHSFEAKGSSEFDRYYCGCFGWD